METDTKARPDAKVRTSLMRIRNYDCVEADTISSQEKEAKVRNQEDTCL